MKEFDLRQIQRGGPMHHDQLEPDVEFVYRRIWSVVGPYHPCDSWEAFEATCCQNENPESEVPFFAYVCGRFEDYQRKNPSADNYKLKRAYKSIIRDYFKVTPFVDVRDGEGEAERHIIKGFEEPTEQMVLEASSIVKKWLLPVFEEWERVSEGEPND